MIEPDWDIRPELVCLTCPRPLVIPRHEQIAVNHRGHLVIVASVFVWPSQYEQDCRDLGLPLIPEHQQCRVREHSHDDVWCTLQRGHGAGSKVHQCWRDGRLWAEWRSILLEDEDDRAPLPEV